MQHLLPEDLEVLVLLHEILPDGIECDRVYVVFEFLRADRRMCVRIVGFVARHMTLLPITSAARF